MGIEVICILKKNQKNLFFYFNTFTLRQLKNKKKLAVINFTVK